MQRKIRTRPAGSDVSVRVIRSRAKRSDTSRQAEDVDEFAASADGNVLLSTPYSVTFLAKVYEQSNVLRQCVEAMVTNVVKFGYRVVAINQEVTIDQGEKDILESFIESPNTEETLVGLQAKKTNDYEKYGFGFIEVIRDARNRVSLLRHVKSFNVRLLSKNGEEVEVITEVKRGGRRSVVKEKKRFRRYLQMTNGKKVYFKEFGDPRHMDYRDGTYATPDKKVPVAFRATEILHERQYSEDSYGLPRWISQLPSILGSRESEEVNLRYFEDNTVPPMIMTVAGGRLTKQSFADLQKLLQAQGLGKDRQNQILLIEAIPETAGLDEKGTVSLKIEKLADVRPSDGLFKTYDDANMSKVRSSFRLPPVIIGLSQDVTFATANVSAYLAETQVFLPERQAHDEFLNRRFINHPSGLNLKTVKIETKGPSVTNPDQIVKTMTAVNVMGGVTPRKAIKIINETMQLSIEQYPEKGEEGYEEWMDTPMQLAQRMVMVGSQQTGEGDSTDIEQEGKDQDIKDREENGATGVSDNAVENGQQ